MQSTAAFANTNGLSVLRNTSNTSSTAATCLCRASFTSSMAVYSILTALRAPKRGLHPDLISVAHASTSSHIEHTTCNDMVGEFIEILDSFSVLIEIKVLRVQVFISMFPVTFSLQKNPQKCLPDLAHLHRIALDTRGSQMVYIEIR